MFVAEVPSLPGCISQGGTRAEATENIKEAIALYIESLSAHNEAVRQRGSHIILRQSYILTAVLLFPDHQRERFSET